jgi:hypothetical protein
MIFAGIVAAVSFIVGWRVCRRLHRNELPEDYKAWARKKLPAVWRDSK